MVTINPSTELFTLINLFCVQPEQQKQLANLLEHATDSVIQHLDGFVSASIHSSKDGTTVVNYAKWESEGKFEAMKLEENAIEHMKEAAKLAISFNPIVCNVVSSHSHDSQTHG